MNDENIIILDKTIKIFINNRNISHYKNLGYDCKQNTEIEVSIEDLSKKARNKVLVKCPICGEVRNKGFREIWKCNHTMCNSCASKTLNSKHYKCKYCGEKATRTYNGDHYCFKHAQQLKKYGKIKKRTCTDKNEVIFKDDLAYINTYDKNGNINSTFIIDKEDYKKIKDYKWCVSNNRIVTENKNKKTIHLSQIIKPNIKNLKYCIHINNNCFDYRKSNLEYSNNKDVLISEIEPHDINNVKTIENVKIEWLKDNRYRLLNVRYINRTTRFDNDVIIEIDDNGCWNCTSHVPYRGGYIQIYDTKENKKIKLHRRTLELKMGRELNQDEIARHKCDNPKCCNPEHLEVGSTYDNYQDMIQRERAYYQTHPEEFKNQISENKVAHYNTSTTKEEAEFIYRKIVQENMKQKYLCDKYNFTRGVVQNIVNKHVWKDLTDKIDEELGFDARIEDKKNKVELVLELLKGDLYTIREIANLSGINRETVREIKNKTIYQEYIPDVNFKELEPVIFVRDIIYDTIVDGYGFRNTVYCSFCNHFCDGCHNKETWKLTSGKPMKISELYDNLVLNNDNNITFSGGDPMYQAKPLTLLVEKIKTNTKKTIWIYTGFTYEELLERKDCLKFLKYVDVLVDGRFEIDKKDITLKFRGSSNQRIIDVQESLKQNKVILWEDPYDSIYTS